jgi:Domain of unknown function (DUF4342)
MALEPNANTEPTVNPPRVVDVDAVEINAEPVDGAPQDTVGNVSTEEFRVQGDELVSRVKDLIHAGNIRRIILKNESGHVLIEIPLTVGVVGGVLGAAFFPVLAAVGAIGAVVAHLTLVIEKRD